MLASVPPLRIVLLTTGFSDIVDSLWRNKNEQIHLIGIMECQSLDVVCCNYAKQNSIFYCFYESFKQLGKWIDSMQVDLIITYKVPFLLPEYIFTAPKYGSINIHPSLLPRYRGANPWFWIYYYMESESGVTIHKLDKYEDHGDILAQASFPIVLGSSLFSLQKKAEKKAIYLLEHLFACWNNICPIPQEEASDVIRATNHFDLKILFELVDKEGVRLWHILKGFPFLLRKLYPEVGEGYSIGRFLSGIQYEEIRQIVFTNRKAYLFCNDGAIEIIITSNK